MAQDYTESYPIGVAVHVKRTAKLECETYTSKLFYDPAALVITTVLLVTPERVAVTFDAP